jgi:Flp pilus assembly CpaF family ATPase
MISEIDEIYHDCITIKSHEIDMLDYVEKHLYQTTIIYGKRGTEKTTLANHLILQLKSLYDMNSRYILIDDKSSLYLRDNSLVGLFINSRHTKTTIIIVVQDIKDIKPIIRYNAISIIEIV